MKRLRIPLSRLCKRLAAGTGTGGEAGMTLVELLVAAAMSVVLVGAAGSMVISAVQKQPELSERSQNVSTARYVLERMTREIRNGVAVYEHSGSQVSFLASVRRTACGAGVEEEDDKPAIRCRITYICSAGTCSRRETSLEQPDTGPTTPIVSGLASSQVFSYAPTFEEPTYVGVTLNIPNPDGSGTLTVSDGASLRTLLLTG
jgi:type II secretory pathway pseudopilin PulG